MAYKENEPDEKKEVFETPKMLDLEGKEITDEELEGAPGGVEGDGELEVGSNTCTTGTGNGNTCSGGSG